jgi:hypothetical protein
MSAALLEADDGLSEVRAVEEGAERLSLINSLVHVLLGLGERTVPEKLGDGGVELLSELGLLSEAVEDDEAAGGRAGSVEFGRRRRER